MQNLIARPRWRRIVVLPSGAKVVTSRWPAYLMEGVELALFMISASSFGVALWYAESPIVQLIPSPLMRRVLMGLAMGSTAAAIILSPLGRRSGAHFNPAVSITFYLLGRMRGIDALFYVIAQFVGGAAGVLVAWLVWGHLLSDSSVRFVVTVPGHYGIPAAFLAECFMGALTMTVVLRSNKSKVFSRFTWLMVGLLVTSYVIAFSPVSGFSSNPARTVSSALFAHVWTGMWIYLSAPLLGMLTAAAVFVATEGCESVVCAKVYHDHQSACPFFCRFFRR